MHAAQSASQEIGKDARDFAENVSLQTETEVTRPATHSFAGLRKANEVTLRIYDIASRKTEFVSVRRWSRGIDVKTAIRKALGVPIETQRLYYGGKELLNHSSILDFTNEPGVVILSLQSLKQTNGRDLNASFEWFDPDLSFLQTNHPHVISALERAMAELKKGLAIGLNPQLTEDGTGGTYFYRNTRRSPMGVFKPTDEEAFAPNNPRGFVGQFGQSGMRPGILSGEATIREVVAFFLDQKMCDKNGRGFFKVPLTIRAEAFHKSFNNPRHSLATKKGSFQLFQSSIGCAGEYGPVKFSRQEVQKIALLDMRLLNIDRNDANILVQCDNDGDEFSLIPIDHGFILPTKLAVDWDNWCWLSWPQLKEDIDPEVKAYILQVMNPKEDVAMIESHFNLATDSTRNILITGMILQKSVESGLRLYDIANIMCRPDYDELSEMEKLVDQAEKLAMAMAQNMRVRVSEGRRHSHMSNDMVGKSHSPLGFGRYLDSLNLSSNATTMPSIVLGNADETDPSNSQSDSESDCESEHEEHIKKAMMSVPTQSLSIIQRSSPQSIPSKTIAETKSTSPLHSLKRSPLIRTSSVSNFKSKSLEQTNVSYLEHLPVGGSLERFFWEYFEDLLAQLIRRKALSLHHL